MAGKHNRDRGRRSERRHPASPADVSIERVDPHTLIVRTPQPLTDDDVAGLLDGVRRRIGLEARGTWLTPAEATELEAAPAPGELELKAQPLPGLDT